MEDALSSSPRSRYHRRESQPVSESVFTACHGISSTSIRTGFIAIAYLISDFVEIWIVQDPIYLAFSCQNPWHSTKLNLKDHVQRGCFRRHSNKTGQHVTRLKTPLQEGFQSMNSSVCSSSAMFDSRTIDKLCATFRIRLFYSQQQQQQRVSITKELFILGERNAKKQFRSFNGNQAFICYKRDGIYAEHG
jgi:hypothetical protein